MKKGERHPAGPVVRVAPLGELNAYTVYEHELDTLSRGSSGSLFLNFALFLLPIFMSMTVTLLTTKIESDRLFQGFFMVAAIAFIAGAFLLVLWMRERRSSRHLISEIKNRMPPPPAIPQALPETGTETGPLPET